MLINFDQKQMIRYRIKFVNKILINENEDFLNKENKKKFS